MFNLRKRLLGRSSMDRSGPTEQEEHERLQVATCLLLLEVAKSDDQFSSIEKATITAILEEEFQLSDEAVAELMEVASKRREESVDLWEFTHLINEHYSEEEKIKVIETVWRVIYADNKLDEYEDYLVHKLAGLLRLRHQELIAAKLRVLEELKPGPAPGRA